MTFHVGQKVVCVDDDGQPFAPFVVKGTIYTVAKCGMVTDTPKPSVGVLLVEVPTVARFQYHAEFRASRFRPVVEHKTDISIFTAMLKPEQVQA